MLHEIKGKLCPVMSPGDAAVRCSDACAAFRVSMKGEKVIEEYCAMMPDGVRVAGALDALYSAIDDLRCGIREVATEQNDRVISKLVGIGIALRMQGPLPFR